MKKDKKYRIIELLLGWIVGFSFMLYLNISFHERANPIVYTLIQCTLLFGFVLTTDYFIEKWKNRKSKGV